jgi:RNA polymerase sigma factor (sigma-70 family)
MESPQSLACLLDSAEQGDRTDLCTVVASITPSIQVGVARVLTRGGRGAARQEVADLVQEILVYLFSDGAKALRRWDPTEGLELASYVRMIAERRTVSRLRSRRTNPFTEEPRSPAELPMGSSVAPTPEAQVAARQTLSRVLERLRQELSPRSFRLFELLYVEERTTQEIQTTLGMTRDAVYTAKRRIRVAADRIAKELERPARRAKASAGGVA